MDYQGNVLWRCITANCRSERPVNQSLLFICRVSSCCWLKHSKNVLLKIIQLMAFLRQPKMSRSPKQKCELWGFLAKFRVLERGPTASLPFAGGKEVLSPKTASPQCVHETNCSSRRLGFFSFLVFLLPWNLWAVLSLTARISDLLAQTQLHCHVRTQILLSKPRKEFCAVRERHDLLLKMHLRSWTLQVFWEMPNALIFLMSQCQLIF